MAHQEMKRVFLLLTLPLQFFLSTTDSYCLNFALSITGQRVFFPPIDLRVRFLAFLPLTLIFDSLMI